MMSTRKPIGLRDRTAAALHQLIRVAGEDFAEPAPGLDRIAPPAG
jgi:hypothetical protein